MRVGELLRIRIASEKKMLEERLTLLRGRARTSALPTGRRRSYPPVLPKFCNPDNPAETWAGRGKRPRWVMRHLAAGKRLDELTIRTAAK